MTSALEAPKQVASKQQQKRGQKSLKAVVSDHRYRYVGVTDQQRERCKKHSKDKGHLEGHRLVCDLRCPEQACRRQLAIAFFAPTQREGCSPLGRFIPLSRLAAQFVKLAPRFGT